MSLIEIEQLLYREIGLDASSIGPHAISKAIDMRMEQCKTRNIEHYYRLLRENDNELKELIDEVVIPETWFFRNGEPFKMITSFARQEWLLRETTTPLRILSVPCATGEEPYSISIALIEAGFTPSQFHIDAIDISKRNIEVCKAGYYRDYSFRGVETNIRERFFRKRNNQYQLDILIRATINFRQASLLDPNIVYTRMPYDVVFCRNLLIYFDNKTQQEARRMLGKLLKDDGILFVGHAETGGFLKDWYASRKYPKAFALRKHRETDISSGNKTKSALRKFTVSRKPLRRVPPKPATQKPFKTEASTAQTTAKANTKLPASLHEAQRLADQGKFTEAEAICLQHLQADSQNAQAYYLLAMVQLAAGHPQKAVDYLKKVVYLQPHHVEALMFLATLTAEQGDPELAARYNERAQRAKQRVITGVIH